MIVPGGGFPDAIVAAFSRLRDPRFGLRVHHFLNGPTRRGADRGEQGRAAQYLRRDAGGPGVVPDGRFTRELADAVRGFQAARDFRDDETGQVTGIIGGETWPALARPVRVGEDSDAARAVEVLLRRRRTESVPDVVKPPVWQHLLAP